MNYKKISILISILNSNNLREIDILKSYGYSCLEQVPEALFYELRGKIFKLRNRINKDRQEYLVKQGLRSRDLARLGGVKLEDQEGIRTSS